MLDRISLTLEKQKSQKWLKKFDKNAHINTYMFDDDGEELIIHASGNIDLSNNQIDKLPYKFGSIDGDFNISNCDIGSLSNAPYEVKGDFIVSNNPIKTLLNCPEYVGRNFDIQGCNQLTSFLCGPQEVVGNYLSTGNQYLKLINKIPTKMGRFCHIITDKKQSLLGLENEYFQTTTHYVFQCLGSKLEHYISVAIQNNPNIINLDSGSFGNGKRFQNQ